MKERIIAISFLFVLFAPVATIYTFLQFEKSAIRREIKGKMIAYMDPEELVLLKFTKEETETKLRWEHSKEFEYNGQMYDIVSSEIKGDSIFYRCWWDYEETELNKKLKKMVALAFNQDEENRETQEIFYSYLWSFFCTDLFDWKATPSQNTEIVYQDAMHLNIFNAIKLSPPTPPPKAS
ncbi:hypothetical protein A7A78_07780 [Aequorivita soesokkakensis]|uniref:Uncharacterized protein n=1 Tax=Aequorivita soesokkakensis TaxID=1385699 RepID=A0A1A9LA03_9FLAO|nr:hypothetical protein [Aequorivita soesokkakensis]OAD90108.1 hypothetical protein A7A78_07780 [Aequorivita soesokkakensis]